MFLSVGLLHKYVFCLHINLFFTKTLSTAHINYLLFSSLKKCCHYENLVLVYNFYAGGFDTKMFIFVGTELWGIFEYIPQSHNLSIIYNFNFNFFFTLRLFRSGSTTEILYLFWFQCIWTTFADKPEHWVLQKRVADYWQSNYEVRH
jgi:hypothetical protein